MDIWKQPARLASRCRGLGVIVDSSFLHAPPHSSGRLYLQRNPESIPSFPCNLTTLAPGLSLEHIPTEASAQAAPSARIVPTSAGPLPPFPDTLFNLAAPASGPLPPAHRAAALLFLFVCIWCLFSYSRWFTYLLRC